MGLSHGKVVLVFDSFFGIKLTRGASCQIGLRTAAKLEPDYQLLIDDLKQLKQLAADETGWRIGGQPAWLHVWVGGRSTAYAIDSQRSFELRLLKLVSPTRIVPEYATFADHLWRHFSAWFISLPASCWPSVPGTGRLS